MIFEVEKMGVAKAIKLWLEKTQGGTTTHCLDRWSGLRRNTISSPLLAKLNVNYGRNTYLLSFKKVE